MSTLPSLGVVYAPQTHSPTPPLTIKQLEHFDISKVTVIVLMDGFSFSLRRIRPDLLGRSY